MAATVIVMMMAAGCVRHGAQSRLEDEHGDTLTSHSQLLTLIDHDGWTMAELRSSANEAPARIALVGADRELPTLSEGVTVVRIPLERSVVGSTVHLGAIAELGATERVAGVTDSRYISDSVIQRGIAEGRIADCGTASAPQLEPIIAARADALLVSPYPGADHSALRRSGIPVIEMADYMEPTPEGRAEWLRLIGRLYGRVAEADSIVEASHAEYVRLKALAAGAKMRPRVVTEQIMSGTWYVPGGLSYMGRMLTDAGGDYPFASDSIEGSMPLDFPAVYARAGDADIWLLKTFGKPVTLSSLKTDYPLNARIKAWQTGEVYVADTERSGFYEEFPFHPERLLAEYIRIFHPELSDKVQAPGWFEKAGR